MLLTADEVRHVAMLARLGLSDVEVERFRDQIAGLLDYIDILQTVDTSMVAPTAQILELRNIKRSDKVRPSLPVEMVLANAPDHEAGFFKVPAVFEDEQASTPQAPEN